eukprot:289831_1
MADCQDNQRYCELLTTDSNDKYCLLDKYSSILLVYGYCKDYISNSYFELCLIDLFVKFYYNIMLQFSITTAGLINHKEHLISRNVSDKKYKDQEKIYCISQIGWNKGIHEFKIQCIEISNGSNAIGIVSNKNGFINFNSTSEDWAHDWAFDSKQAGITYQIYFRKHKWNQANYDGIYSHNTGIQKYNRKIGIKWKPNDIITLNINCDKSMLTFYINDKIVGKPVQIIQNTKYFPAIAFGGSNHANFKFIP